MITLLFMAIGLVMLILAASVFSLGILPIVLILGFIFMFLFSVKFALLTMALYIIYRIVAKILRNKR